MVFSSEPIAGVSVGDGDRKAADADGDQDDVQHSSTPEEQAVSGDAAGAERQDNGEGDRQVHGDNKPDFEHHVSRTRRIDVCGCLTVARGQMNLLHGFCPFGRRLDSAGDPLVGDEQADSDERNDEQKVEHDPSFSP
jgi:hypothetical protein